MKTIIRIKFNKSNFPKNYSLNLSYLTKNILIMSKMKKSEINQMTKNAYDLYLKYFNLFLIIKFLTSSNRACL